MLSGIMCHNTEYRGPLGKVKYSSEQAEETLSPNAVSLIKLLVRGSNLVCVSLRAQVKGVVKKEISKFPAKQASKQVEDRH